MLWAAVTPPPVYVLCLTVALIWVLAMWWRLRPAGDLVNLFVLLSVIQFGAACLALWHTAENPIAQRACMLGISGMMANVAYFALCLVVLTGLRLFAPRRFAVFGGIALPSAILVMGALAMLAHTRSALLCTV